MTSQQPRSYVLFTAKLRKGAKILVNVNKPASLFGFQIL